MEHFDVIVVGAGLSGIGAAYHFKTRCPNKSFVVLEGREQLGGTWDLFRYPGIRSDSDMFTLGYAFKPWTNPKAIADGPAILAYLRDTAREHGIDRKIRYGHRVKHVAWSSQDARWTLDIERPDGATLQLTCSFLSMCTGYYDYASGYDPAFPGRERFRGRIVHPQKWTSDVEYAGKRVVVIGSGATAVTLVPELAKQAAHVVMLQRSPTYIASLPAEDKLANALRAVLPPQLAYDLSRWKAVLRSQFFYQLARRRPQQFAKALIDLIEKRVGPEVDVQKHFTPKYKPWDQRLCLVPDNDLFDALRERRASIVTDTIESFTETGIQLTSGETLEADLIVTATGLQLQFLGGATGSVDGEPMALNKAFNYRGCMFSDIPNFAVAVGYTNASWTLKVDLTSAYVCRVINHMDAIGARQCTPRVREADLREEPILDFNSGYVQRAASLLPKQGSKHPWKLYQNYIFDIVTLRYAPVDDGTLEFSGGAVRSAAGRTWRRTWDALGHRPARA
jgi:cation diffusion facilitator CzcD-associated flavoprotein CzcO